MRIALTGARLLDPERDRPVEETLLIEAGRIVDRLPADREVGEDWRQVGYLGRFLAPGFIDVHFHGALFHAPTDALERALRADGQRMLARGTTAYLATTLCWEEPVLGERVERLAGLCEGQQGASASQGEPTARCLGLHLEGPWLSRAVPGALAAEAIRPFDSARDTALLERGGDQIRMVTLAPEVEGAPELLDALASRGAVASLGHSLAGRDEIDRGIERGLCHVTHLFNAMGPIHHREPGVAARVLAEDRLSCDLICDGHHVHPDVVRVAARALGDRMVLITDRVELEQGNVVPEPDEPWRLADGTLAGSQLELSDAVRNVTRFAGLSLIEAVAAATLRPAKLLGIENDCGTLRRGARADFAILDEQGSVVETWLGGRPFSTCET